jgi:prepilin-type processing-associated H-X9-DG protein
MESYWVDVCTRYANWERYYSSEGTDAGQAKRKFPNRVAEERVHRHNRGSLIVFADGHASWRPADRIFGGAPNLDGGVTSNEGMLVRQY